MVACSRNRPTWHVREEAGRHGDKASFFSKGNNKLMINQVQTQKDALVVEVTGKLVETDKGQEPRNCPEAEVVVNKVI